MGCGVHVHDRRHRGADAEDCAEITPGVVRLQRRDSGGWGCWLDLRDCWNAWDVVDIRENNRGEGEKG